MLNDQCQILVGDTRALLPTLADQSVQCIVTSPPYYGLRDYGTGSWCGGASACDHKVDSQSGAMRHGPKRDGLSPDPAYFRSNDEVIRDICGKCGAHRVDQQIGIESSPDAYVATLVDIFREARRTLHDSGTLWLNIGDSYVAHKPRERGVHTSSLGLTQTAAFSGAQRAVDLRSKGNLKDKDLLGIPWTLALALRADGWYLRSDIIWNKPNPLPESVKDRPTSAHEHVFLLSKKPIYYYDAHAIAEPATNRASGNRQKSWGTNETAIRNEGLGDVESLRGIPWHGATTRNARNVWTITPKPCKEAHFATMPVELAARCISAGSRIGDTILDPFGGAGTTAVAAIERRRRALLIELKPDYAAIALQRMQNVILPDWVE